MKNISIKFSLKLINRVLNFKFYRGIFIAILCRRGTQMLTFCLRNKEYLLQLFLEINLVIRNVIYVLVL